MDMEVNEIEANRTEENEMEGKGREANEAAKMAMMNNGSRQ